jgi:ketosteroid isomerase-like protein
MDNTKVEKQILDLERKYWRAMQENDIDTAMELTDFPCIVSGPSGIRKVDRQSFQKMMTNPSYTIRKVEMGDKPEVRVLRDDIVIVAYKIHEDVTVDGKATSLDAADSSTWVQRDGQWRCALHTEAIAGDSFGRDRKAQEKSASR